MNWEWRRFRIPVGRAALALVAVACAGAFSGAGRAADVGVEPDLNWGISHADQDRSAAAIAGLGAKWVRLTVQWKYWEPDGPSTVALPSTGSMQDTDRSVQLVRNGGAKVIIDVYNAPDWARAAASSDGQVPKRAADFANFMHDLAAHYKGQVAAYELWNEEDLGRFWAGGPDPVKYTELLKAAYPAIKSADASALVVFGGVSWDWTRSGNFVQRCYDAGAEGSFDVLAVHAYPTPDTDLSLTDWRSWFAKPHALMTQEGDGGKPIWITEFGINTSTATRAGGAWQAGVSEDAQAALITRAFKILDTIPYVGVAVYYNLRNNYWSKDDPSDLEANFGLLRSDFTKKPAYDALAQLAHAQAPSPATAPQVALVTPVDGSGFWRSLVVTARASADGGVARVDFFVDGQLVYRDTAAPYSFSWSGAKKADSGTHTITAVAFDGASLSTSTSVKVVKTSTRLRRLAIRQVRRR